MADPLTMIAIGLTVAQGIGQMQAASAQAASIKAAGRNQAMIQRYQADLVERQGVVQQQEAEFRAEQAKTRAGQERASAQRAAIEAKRRGRFAESTARAQAAASGGTVLDFYDEIADIGVESEYSAMVNLFEGEDIARDLETQGSLALYEGEEAVRAAGLEAQGLRTSAQMTVDASRTRAANTKRAGFMQALGTFASAGTSLAGKYGPSGAYDSSIGSAGARSSYFPQSNTTVSWR